MTRMISITEEHHFCRVELEEEKRKQERLGVGCRLLGVCISDIVI